MTSDYIKIEEKAAGFSRIGVSADQDELYVSAEEQEWHNPTAQIELRKLDVFFSSCGVLPVRLIERASHNPMIQIGTEDDGTAVFNDSSPCFDIYWARHLISDLEDAIAEADRRGLITFQRDFTVNKNTPL